MHYQQAQRIEVIVRKEGGGGEKNNKETDIDTEKNGEQSAKTSGLSRRAKRFVLTNLTHGIAVGKQAANAAVNYYVGGLGYEYGDTSLQHMVERQVEIVNDHINTATSIGMGMTYGSFGGIPGMILGGVFGGASAAVSLISKYANRERDFNYKVFKENNAIEYQRARASINLTTGRLR